MHRQEDEMNNNDYREVTGDEDRRELSQQSSGKEADRREGSAAQAGRSDTDH